MQPRILVKEQGQNKKRFISPAEIKHNQALYGDPLGATKINPTAQPSSLMSDKVYSPQNRRSIADLEKQQSQKLITSKISQSPKPPQIQRVRSIGQSSSKLQSSVNSQKSKSKSKSGSGKKDYMLSTLARLNRKKTKQSDEQSNGSQSGSRINSIKSSKQPKQPDQEYRKNVYNQKQKQVKRRGTNQQQEEDGSSLGSSQGFRTAVIDGNREADKDSVYGKDYKLYNGDEDTKNKLGLGDMKCTKQLKNNQQNNTVLVREKKMVEISKIGQKAGSKVSNEKLREERVQIQQGKQEANHQLKFEKRRSKEQAQEAGLKQGTMNVKHQIKEVKSVQQEAKRFQQTKQNEPIIRQTPFSQNNHFYRQQVPATQQGHNSSLALHLKKAHEQKDQLYQKKLTAERQRNQLQQKLSTQEQDMAQMRREIQHLQVQNLSLNSELKSLRQTQTKTKTQMLDTNSRNEYVYRQLHHKHEQLTQDYKNILTENDLLRDDNQRLKLELINSTKKVSFLQNKIVNLETLVQNKEQEHKQQMKQTVDEWRGKVEVGQKELRKLKKEGESTLKNGGSLGEVKIRLMECESQLSHKSQLLAKREEELKLAKKQSSIRTSQLDQLLHNKDKQLKELTGQLTHLQHTLSHKSAEFQSQAKQMHVKNFKLQKDLQMAQLQLEQHTKHRLDTGQAIAQIYHNTDKTNIESNQAKHSLEQIISQQTSELNACKVQLNKTINDNFALNSQLEENKAQLNNAKQDLAILQLQYSALEKKLTQNTDTQMYLLKSQLEAAVRKQTELQQKLESKTKEVHEKDEFIQMHIMQGNKR